MLDKQLESFIELKSSRMCIPWMIYNPGMMFPLSKILNPKKGRTYAPNGLLSSSAGARSTFLLPNIGCVSSHSNLQRDFNIKLHAPKTLYDHWNIFKEILNSPYLQTNWRCSILYFSETWLYKINHDKTWSILRDYLLESALSRLAYEIHRVDYDMIFSIIQQNRNLKPNPYLTDTAKHILTTALGAVPGYTPAVDDEALPASILQKVYTESYGLKKYIPVIMHPTHYNFDSDKLPIYYSFNNPSTHVFSPKSRIVTSTLLEMRELEHILSIFIEELSKDDNLCSKESIMNKIVSNIEFNFYHNKMDRHGIVNNTEAIVNIDSRFRISKYQAIGAKFPSDAPFLKRMC